MNYPEHEKLKAVQPDSQKLGEFLEWLQAQGWVIAQWDNEELGHIGYTTQQILAQYFEINLKKVEEEKRAMLEHQRRLNESGKRWEEP